MVVAITEKQNLIYNGKHCPYCDIPTKIVDSTVVYRQNYGKIYYCDKCGAYVGCHNNSEISKGRVANKELRKLKIEAHLYFDKIWKTKQMKRHDAYKWLSDKLNIPKEYTHIGMFSIKTCKDVVYYSKQLLNDLRRLELDFGQEPKTQYYELN